MIDKKTKGTTRKPKKPTGAERRRAAQKAAVRYAFSARTPSNYWTLLKQACAADAEQEYARAGGLSDAEARRWAWECLHFCDRLDHREQGFVRDIARSTFKLSCKQKLRVFALHRMIIDIGTVFADEEYESFLRNEDDFLS